MDILCLCRSSRSSTTSSWSVKGTKVILARHNEKTPLSKKLYHSRNCINLQPHKDFECIVDSPLGSSKCSDHDNTERKTTGKETPHAELLHRLN